ncbi:hypothetical protein ACFO6R_10245 [Eubacterium multiforme]|uniref:DNA-directed RNA polymerase specialized sigma subunit n=1 Tax=Eubacterium multiforme TaxID=83339 RepID=A0ABT9USR0_9FIRM|nr:hypothetical protein [Eubacterium multiforme]MDQ0149336.1 DNA-directed RNA polymerase specialized sigma subunit [Eubacterium multiforme]
MTNKNELFRKAEWVLYGYNDLLYDIDLIREDIRMTEEEYQGCSGLSYEEKGSPTNAFSSVVENELINKERLLRELKLDLNNKIRMKNRIETAVNKLNGADKKVIELRYINKSKLNWNQIGFAVNYSADHCRKRIRVRAIKKMINTIFYDAGKQETFKI